MTLFIPETIQVGYDLRKDTLDGKLGFVIYYDKKGKLRQEKSFNTWIDSSLGVDKFNNEPTEGFIVNKNVKRYNRYSGTTERHRIYDPRGFEMEIDSDNLITILLQNNSNMGTLNGQYVYAWNGAKMVLLPVGSEEYKVAKEYTKISDGKVYSKDLKVGMVVKNKENIELVFIGREGKEYVFKRIDRDAKIDVYKNYWQQPIMNDNVKYLNHPFKWENNLRKILQIVDKEPHPNTAEYISLYEDLKQFNYIESFKTEKLTIPLTGEPILPQFDEIYKTLSKRDKRYVTYEIYVDNQDELVEYSFKYAIYRYKSKYIDVYYKGKMILDTITVYPKGATVNRLNIYDSSDNYDVKIDNYLLENMEKSVDSHNIPIYIIDKKHLEDYPNFASYMNPFGIEYSIYTIPNKPAYLYANKPEWFKSKMASYE